VHVSERLQRVEIKVFFNEIKQGSAKVVRIAGLFNGTVPPHFAHELAASASFGQEERRMSNSNNELF